MTATYTAALDILERHGVTRMSIREAVHAALVATQIHEATTVPRVRVSTTLMSAYGMVRWANRSPGSPPKEVVMSWPLSKANPPEDVADTIAHEVAHVLAGHGHGHDEVWEAACELTGAEPTSCKAGENNLLVRRWLLVCTAHGVQSHRRGVPRLRWTCECGNRCLVVDLNNHPHDAAHRGVTGATLEQVTRHHAARWEVLARGNDTVVAALAGAR